MLEFYYCFIIIGLFGLGKIIIVFQLVYWKCVVGGRLWVYFCCFVYEFEFIVVGKEDVYIIVDDWLDCYMYYFFILFLVIVFLIKFYDEFI